MRPPRDLLVQSAISADRVPVGPHPDAEMLGLFADRALDGEELRAVESHVASCVRCQAVVGDVVISAPVGQPEDATVDAGWLGWFGGWRWAMPVASLAAVAAMAIWVGGRAPQHDAARVAEATREEALAKAGAPGASAAGTQASALAPSAAAAARAPEPTAERQPSANTFALAAPPNERYALAESSMPSERATANSGAAPSDADAPRARTADAAVASARPAAPADTSAGPAGAVDTSATGARERTTAAEPAALADAAAAPLEARAQAKATAEARAESSATAAAPAPAPMAAPSLVRPAAAAAGPPVNQARPRVTLNWRVVGGRVERATGAERAWRAATMPTGLILAVAEVSARVAWAISAEAVLRTSDGETWVRISGPPDPPFSAIVAIDASRATVTAASGVGYATSDGGASWRRVP